MNRVLIYRKARYLATNAGGPDGYLAHLKLGLGALDQPPLGADFIGEAPIQTKPATPPTQAAHPIVAALGDLRRNLTSRIHLLTGFPRKLDPFFYRSKGPDEETLAALRTHDVVHVHFTRDADVLLRLREAGRWSGKIILSSHSPETPALEMAATLKPKHYCGRYYEYLEKALLERDLAAFRGADAWIFPSEGAMEPYHQTLPGFTELAKHKTVRFLPTGIRAKDRPAQEAVSARRIAPPGALQIAFVGRHESVKGYDLFVEAALRFLDEHPSAHVVCAGTGPLPPPSHPRWHELGRINDVHALMAASDLFVLPNRRTYYDLVLIEALAAGIPVLATATGGNRDVAAQCEAVRLAPPDADGLFAGMRAVADLPASERERLRGVARAHYENAHTETRFAGAYLDTLRSLLDELSR